MGYSIKGISAREVLDSRGNPTVEVELSTDKGISSAMVPSGASTGVHEALELRDNGKRYLGKGVQKAVSNVDTKIKKKIAGFDCRKQDKLDELLIALDGTENKGRLGANAVLAVSMASCRAAALEQNMPLYAWLAKLAGTKRICLPVPSMNVINGGKHAGNGLDVQEYMILPTGAKSFTEAVRMCAETYHILKKIIKEKYGKDAINVGDEGGFAPPLKQAEEPLNLITSAIEEAGYTKQMKLGMDAAASEFYDGSTYMFQGENVTGDELSDKYAGMIKKYPIVSCEDLFAQDDWRNWGLFTRKYGGRVQVVGDDLLVTNVERIERAIKLSSCNALLLKINQIGSITESIAAAKTAQKAGWNVMVSHRSGETEDAFIADLAVALGCGQIKSGAPCRSERNAKYNRLMRIEEALGSKAKYGTGKLK
jgi:enolase